MDVYDEECVCVTLNASAVSKIFAAVLSLPYFR